MNVQLRNFVSCEEVEYTGLYTLKNVRFKWPTPPPEVDFWLDILNPAAGDVSVRLELYRGRDLVDYTEEELVPPGFEDVQVRFTLDAAGLEKKSYTGVAQVNGFALGRLVLDFGAPDA